MNITRYTFGLKKIPTNIFNLEFSMEWKTLTIWINDDFDDFKRDTLG